MFEINFEDQNSERKLAWQTSWGLSTRSIGAMIMVHSDDTGLILPPKVAQVQVVIVPINKKGDDYTSIHAAAKKVYQALKEAGVRVELDDRENYNPGFKYNHWELRGVPVRLELG
jgi:prolyl-tRNA synthetase